MELHDNYAKITISEHGKEGVGVLRCIDSFYYLSQWYNLHPLKDDPEAHLFINLGTRGKYEQLKPSAANIQIRRRLKRLGIAKPITLYSLKRNGVTHCRLRGDSDVDIQHRARWSSTKQLRTYDLSHQDDSFKLELMQRGLIEPDDGHRELAPRTKACTFCHAANGSAEITCANCRRPLDRKVIEQEVKQRDTEREQLQNELSQMKRAMHDVQSKQEKVATYVEKFSRIAQLPQFGELLKEIENGKEVTEFKSKRDSLVTS